MNSRVSTLQSRAGRVRMRRYAVVAVVMLLALADSACSTAGNTSPGATTTPSAPAATDAAGKPIIRPRCAAAAQGLYMHAAGPTTPIPVLLLGDGPRGVVVGAQANGGICQMLPFRLELISKGYHVAVFDWGRPYNEAMVAATRALIAAGATKVVLGGFSRGALVALGVAPSLGSPIAGVFSVSGGPSSTQGFDTVASPSQFSGPIPLVGSEGDPLFPAATTEAIAAGPTGPGTGLIIPGSDHALGLLRGPDAERVQAALDRFLVEVLP